MMIRSSFKYAILAIAMLAAMSCSSMNSDAKKAASLINKSIEQTQALKLENAEKTYLKAQKIIDKYKEKEKSDEFFKLFVNYRDKEKKQNSK